MELTRVEPSRVVHSSEMDYFNLLKIIALNRHDGFIRIIKESKEGHILFREGEEIAASYVEYIENKLRSNGEKLVDKEYSCENAIEKIENNIANKNDYIMEICEFNTSQIDFAMKLNQKYLLKPLKENEKPEPNSTLEESPKKSISVQKPSKIEINPVPANQIQNNYELLHDTKDSSPDFKKVVEAAVNRSRDKAESVYGSNLSSSQDYETESGHIEPFEVKPTLEDENEAEKSIPVQKSEFESSIELEAGFISSDQVKSDSELSGNKESIGSQGSEFESSMEQTSDSVSSDKVQSGSEALSDEEPLLDYRTVIEEAVSRSRDKAESVYGDKLSFSQDSKTESEFIDSSEAKITFEDEKEVEKPIFIQESGSESSTNSEVGSIPANQVKSNSEALPMTKEPIGSQGSEFESSIERTSDSVSSDKVQSGSEALSDEEPLLDYKTVIEEAVSRSRDKAESVYGDKLSFSQDSKTESEFIELSEANSAHETEKEVKISLKGKSRHSDKSQQELTVDSTKREEPINRSDLLKKYGIKEINEENINGLLESYNGNGLSSKEIENMEIALVNKIHKVIMSIPRIKKAIVKVFIDNSNELGGMVDIIIEYESKSILDRIRGVSNNNMEMKTIKITRVEIKKIFKNYPEAVKNFEINVESF